MTPASDRGSEPPPFGWTAKDVRNKGIPGRIHSYANWCVCWRCELDRPTPLEQWLKEHASDPAR